MRTNEAVCISVTAESAKESVEKGRFNRSHAVKAERIGG